MSFSLAYFRSEVRTVASGIYRVHTGRPTSEFWADWRGAKDSLRGLGYTVYKDAGEFLVEKWEKVLENGKAIPSEHMAKGYEISSTSILKSYQVDAASQLVAGVLKYGSMADLSDTGVGKTYHALGALRELQKFRVGIVCPIRSIDKWRDLCDAFGVSYQFIVNWEGARALKFPYKKKGFRFEWSVPPGTFLIFDEAHRAKGLGTKNSDMVVSAGRRKIPCLLLSATLAASPLDMLASGFVLGLHALSDFREFCQRHGCYQVLMNKKEMDAYESARLLGENPPMPKPRYRWSCADAVDTMRSLSREIIPTRAVRVKIADLGDAFPETQITAEAISIGEKNSAKQNKAYGDLLEKVAELLEKKEKGYQAATMTLNLRYRQIAELLKAEALADLAKDYLENKLSVILFCNFTETILELKKLLSCDCLLVGEDVQPKEKTTEAMRDFQANRKSLIICNVQAGGESIDLHDVHGGHPRVSLICPTYRAMALRQVFGRPHRQEGKSKSLQRLIYARGTVEEEVCATVSMRLSAISALNDGDLSEPGIRGVG